MVRFSVVGMLACATLAFTPAIQAQSVCSSDGVAPPTRLLERFFNADCDICWAAGAPATASEARGTLALDWIVPSAQGDEAPLSAAALREAVARLDGLNQGRPPPGITALRWHATVARPHPSRPVVRVAMGPPLGGYAGVSIEVRHMPSRSGRAAAAARWTLWLAMVETLPAGSEGSLIPRNLIRNLLTASLSNDSPLSESKQNRVFESRVMSVPDGARRERLRVVGWLEDGQGRLHAIGEAVCTPDTETR